MIGWWQFDKTDGKTVFDSSGIRLDGKLVGDAHIISDPERGNVLSLDGDGDYMYVANNPLLNFVNSMTLAAWMKAGSSDKLYHDIFSKGEGCWRLGLDAWLYSYFYCCGLQIHKAEAFYTIAARADWKDGKWHHVAGVYDGKTMSIYIDGQIYKSAAAAGVMNTRTWPVLIGANPSVIEGERDWNGLIDDARIYSYALSEDEIKAIYADRGSDSRR